MPGVLGLVSFRIFPTHMGGQKGVALFYKYLQQHLNVVLAVSTDNQPTSIVKTERILYPNKRIYRNFFKTDRLKQLIQSNSPDVIITEHSYTGWLGWMLHRGTGKPFIIHSHNIESRRFKEMKKWWWKLYHWYEGWIHRKAQHNFFISEDDLQFAAKEFRLPPSKCFVITYGIEKKDLRQDKISLRKQIGLSESKTILLFNGTLDYEPNYDAVVAIVDKIEPLLRERITNYEIVITGNRARNKLIQKMLTNPNVNYVGYVDDVDLYYQAADLFINPVSNDTGVKTKLIEAIANNCTAVSTEQGASGIKKDLCGDKLITVAQQDWNNFVDRIVECVKSKQTFTPQEFYDFYSWENITKKASEKILELL